MKEEIDQRDSSFMDLPENCISCILAFTSPKDTCKLATVSQSFRSAVDCDVLWKQFLPWNYKYLISKILPYHYRQTLLNSFSYRQIYDCLSDGVFLDPRLCSSIKLEKSSGQLCYLIGALDIEQIRSSVDLNHWLQELDPASRFCCIAKSTDYLPVLEISVSLEMKRLMLETRYRAYFIYKLCENIDGYQNKVHVQVYLEGEDDDDDLGIMMLVILNPPPEVSRNHIRIRSDGFMEIVMGEFTTGRLRGNDVYETKKIVCALREVEEEDNVSRYGLIVEGIEFRPINIFDNGLLFCN